MHLASRCAPQIPKPDYRWDGTEPAQAGGQRQVSLHPETRQRADHFYSTASPVGYTGVLILRPAKKWRAAYSSQFSSIKISWKQKFPSLPSLKRWINLGELPRGEAFCAANAKKPLHEG
ncbi:hypothetical protein N7481_006881 [Penicillium waksmanii]|uniref:uncharacterized protein n=1 Tax=Penicillium waksmanii TaxID=69791 RepID=UPI002547D1A5|nr:uncharacterized protein N7481_006881 [Penicillium waksmanii]KAJ5979583.1 hypothetical protein N7481_006881 [Penicillium waksmanii]